MASNAIPSEKNGIDAERPSAAALANKVGDSGASPAHPLSKEHVAAKDEAMGATVHRFDPSATPEEKAAQIAKTESGLGPIPGAEGLIKRKPPPQALSAGGGQKIDTTVTPADAAKTTAVEAEAQQPQSPPGGMPTSPAGVIPEWFKIGWADQVPQQDLTASPEEAIQESILGRFISDLYFANIFYTASNIVFAVLASYYVARFGGGWGWLFIIVGVCGRYQTLAMGRFRHRSRDDMTRELSRVRQFTEVETVDWINHFLTRFWLIYEPVLSKTIVQSVDATLSASCPSFLDSLALSTFTLGTKAPRIDHIRTFPDTAEDIVVMDWKISFTPNDTADLTVRQAANKVNPKIVLAISVGKGPAVLTKDIVVEDISFVGAIRLRLQLMTEFPHVKTVDLSFMQPPLIDFILKPIGFDIKLIPGLDHFIHGQVDANLGPMMYHPNVFTLDLEQLLSGVPLDVAIGVLQITVQSGAQIKGIKLGGGNPDPYISFSISQRAELARTKTKPNTQNPRWNETKYLLINNYNETLNLSVRDFNDHRKDGELGMVTFDLKQLQTETDHENIEGHVVLAGKRNGFVKYDAHFFPVLTPKKLPDGTEEMVPETRVGLARIILHQAKELDKKRVNVRKINSYAEIRLDGELVHTTPALQQTLSPIWESAKEVLVFSRTDAVIGVRVLDHKSGTEALLGYANIKLNDIIEANAKQQDWFPLSGCDTGRIRLEVQWKGLNMTGAISGANLYSAPIGVLRLFIKNAIDLKNVEAKTAGKSDPYVRIHQAGVVMARTLVINNNLDPVWNEYVYVAVHDRKTRFKLEAMDYQEKTKDRSLGVADIEIDTLLEEGTDQLKAPWKSTGKQNRTVQLAIDGKRTMKGTVVFEIEFLPSANVAATFAPPERTQSLTSAGNESINGDAASITELPESHSATTAAKTPATPSKRPELNGSPPVSPGQASLAGEEATGEKAKSDKPELSLEEALKSQSGILAMHVIGGQISNPKRRGRLEIFVNSEYWPAYATEAARSDHPTWDEVGEAFVKELDFTHVLLKLNSAEKDTVDEVYADARIDLHSFLEMSYKKRGVFELSDPTGGHKSLVTITCNYIPTEVKLDARESINNMGILTVDLIDAKDLLSADRNGKSDPYAVFELNGTKIFKSKVIKRTLAPKWNEEFEAMVPSRVGAEFIIKVYDWDAVGTPDKLGQASISLEDLEPLEPMAKTLQLAKQGTNVYKGDVNIRMLFRPEFIARHRAATSTFSRGGRAGTGLSSIESISHRAEHTGAGIMSKVGLLRGRKATNPAPVVDGNSVHTSESGQRLSSATGGALNGVLVPTDIATRDFASEPSSAGTTGTLKVAILRINTAESEVKPYVTVAQNGRALDKAHHLNVSRAQTDHYSVTTSTGPCVLTFALFDRKTFGKDRALGAIGIDVWSHINPTSGHTSATPSITIPNHGSIEVSLDFSVGSGKEGANNDSPTSVRTSRSRFRHSTPAPSKDD